MFGQNTDAGCVGQKEGDAMTFMRITKAGLALALLVVPSVAVLGLAVVPNAAAQTFSLTGGSPTIPPPAAPCGPAWSAAGDIYLGPAPPVMVAPMGPPGCGLGWPVPAPPGNVDAFSSGLSLPPPGIPVPPGAMAFLFSVGPLATGDAGGCIPAAPGPVPPDLGSEACAQPVTTDANIDIFATLLNPAPLPFFGPVAMPNTQIFDGDGLPAVVCPFAPQPPLGLLEPSPGGDGLDAFDLAPVAAWDFVPPGGDGIPDIPVYYSVGPVTAAAGGFAPADVLVTMGGAPPVPYAVAPALGLDIVGGPGTDDLNALAVFDVDGLPFAFTPAAGDIVLFSVAKGSALVGTPDPCPLSPLFLTPIEEGDILTEGSALGLPGAACILVPEENIGLWAGRSCGANPLTGGGADNLDALDTSAVPVPTTTPPPTPTPTPTPSPSGDTPTPTQTVTPTGAAPTATCTVPPPAGPTPTPADPKVGLKCQRTIAKEASKLAKAKVKAFQKCADSIVSGKLSDPGQGARIDWCENSDLKTKDKLEKAESKIEAKIDKACGGSVDKECGGDATGEETTASLGFFATCPDFESSGELECTATISTCDELAECISCISGEAVDQAVELYYEDLNIALAGTTLNKCQRTIGKETSKYLLAKEKELLKCWDARLKGKHTGTCPDHTALSGTTSRKAADKIAKAESKKITKICKACGGDDKQCDDDITPVSPLLSTITGSGGTGADADLTPAAIGFPGSCDAVTVPNGGPSCSQTINTLADAVECLDCVTEFKVDCMDAAGRPQFQQYPCECR